MADHIRKGTASDNDWSDAGSWDGGVPVAAGDIYFNEGTSVITQNLPASGSGLDYNTINVQSNWAGSVGNSSNILYVGNVAEVRINSRRMQEFWIAVDSADAITAFYVDQTSSNANAVHIYDGTVSNLFVRGGQMVRIGASASITNLWVSGGVVFIEQGADVDTVYQTGGIVENYSDIDVALNIYGGTWNHRSVTAASAAVAALEVGGRGRFNFASKGGTIATARVLGPYGLLDCNQGFGTPRTITTLYRHPGGTVDVSGIGESVTITSDNDYGGVLKTFEPAGGTT